MDRLAIHGGEPYRKRPFPPRTPFGEEEVELVTQAIRSQNLFRWGGRMVDAFEQRFAALYGARFAVTATSGTAAIHLAVGTVDPNPGDEIITAPISDLGSVTPILQQNAIPIFADIDPATFNMDPEDVERKITPRTRAILVVHLFGNGCDMDAMTEIAWRHGLPLIEDCSQAHATQYRGRWLGTMGDFGCFSLQQSKHMTTGDGGVTITSDEKHWERLRFFVDKGFRRQGWGPRAYLFLAPNYRMTELEGAVGLAQIPKVRRVVEQRMALGRRLTEMLAEVEGVQPAAVTPGSEHSYWAYPLRTGRMDGVAFGEALRAEGVPNMPGYIGKPIYLCAESLVAKRTYGSSGFPFDSPYTERRIEYREGMCPRTDEGLRHMLTLGINEYYTEPDLADIAGAVAKVAHGLRAQ
ncbi:MAG: DegT/DnrJ/EryC1/StrS family aminotransferase [Candidatus Latescibacterota bacterium]